MHRSPAYGKIKSHSSALNKQEHFFQDFSVNMKSICYICISQCAVISHYSTRKSLKTPCQLVIWFGCIYYRLDQMCAGSNRVVQIKHFKFVNPVFSTTEKGHISAYGYGIAVGIRRILLPEGHRRGSCYCSLINLFMQDAYGYRVRTHSNSKPKDQNVLSHS